MEDIGLAAYLVAIRGNMLNLHSLDCQHCSSSCQWCSAWVQDMLVMVEERLYVETVKNRMKAHHGCQSWPRRKKRTEKTKHVVMKGDIHHAYMLWGDSGSSISAAS